MGSRQLGTASLPCVAWHSGHSTQPLQRQRAWSAMFFLVEVGLSLELQVVIGGRVSDPKQPLPHHPTGLEGSAERVQCARPEPSHMVLGTGVPAASPASSTRQAAGLGAVLAPPGTPRFLLGSRTSTHRQPQSVVAQTGRGNRHGVRVMGMGAWHGATTSTLAQGPSGGPCSNVGLGEELGEGVRPSLFSSISLCAVHNKYSVDDPWKCLAAARKAAEAVGKLTLGRAGPCRNLCGSWM